MSNEQIDDTAERFSMIEMDELPTKIATPVKNAPAISKPVTATVANTEPAWLTVAKQAVATAKSKNELRTAIEPYRLRPEADKALLRPFMQAREAELTQATVKQAIPVVVEAPVVVAPEPAPIAVPEQTYQTVEHTDLITDLQVAATEAASNATVQASGSLAARTMAGVGFTSAEGYVTALAHGVKAATAESYKQTLRGTYKYTAEQIAALTVTIIAESALPVGKGIAHIPTGKSIFDLPRDQRQMKLGVTTESRAEVKALLAEGQLIAAALGDGSNQTLQLSWIGGGATTVAKLTEKFAECGLTLKVPTASDERYAGNACKSVACREVHSERAKVKSADALARWVVTQKGSASLELQVGDAAGATLLIVELLKDGSLRIQGEDEHPNLAERVKAHYTTARSSEVLRSDVMTAWYGSQLRAMYGVKRGANWYVPGGKAADARKLSETLEACWGTHDRIPVTNGPDMMRSIGLGLLDEVKLVEANYAVALTQAQERERMKYAKQCAKENAVTTPEGLELAAKRAVVLPERANTLLLDLIEVGVKLTGYETLLGSEAMKPTVARLKALRAIVEPLTEIRVVELD